MLSNDISHLN